MVLIVHLMIRLVLLAYVRLIIFSGNLPSISLGKRALFTISVVETIPCLWTFILFISLSKRIRFFRSSWAFILFIYLHSPPPLPPKKNYHLWAYNCHSCIISWFLCNFTCSSLHWLVWVWIQSCYMLFTELWCTIRLLRQICFFLQPQCCSPDEGPCGLGGACKDCTTVIFLLSMQQRNSSLAACT